MMCWARYILAGGLLAASMPIGSGCAVSSGRSQMCSRYVEDTEVMLVDAELGTREIAEDIADTKPAFRGGGFCTTENWRVLSAKAACLAGDFERGTQEREKLTNRENWYTVREFCEAVRKDMRADAEAEAKAKLPSEPAE
jgi:hypothetical protein